MSVGARTFLRQHLSVVARDRTVGREKNNDDLAALKIAANYEIFMNFVFSDCFYRLSEQRNRRLSSDL